MSDTKFEPVYEMFDTNRSLINALGMHFGIPLDKLMIGSHLDPSTDINGPIEVVLRIGLTVDDLIAAAEIMRAKESKQ